MTRPTSTIIFISLVAIWLFPFAAEGKPISLTKEYTYHASDNDSKNTSRDAAVNIVKKLLLEELGTYIESETTVKNFQLDKDVIRSLAAGMVSTEILAERWDGKTYYLKAKLSADPEEIAQSIQRLKTHKDDEKDTKTQVPNDKTPQYVNLNKVFACSELTVKDKTTGLIWIKNGRLKTRPINWFDNQKLIQQLNKDAYGGYSDWRLPTYEELGRLAGYAIGSGYGHARREAVATSLSGAEFASNEKKYMQGRYIYDYLNANCFENVLGSVYITSTHSQYDDEQLMGLDMRYGVVLTWSSISNAWLLAVRKE